MNKFIVIIPEDYDMYTIEVPYPILTNSSIEDFQDWLESMADAACEYLNMDKRKSRHITEPEFDLGTYKVRCYQIVEQDPGDVFRPKPLRLLELNDWLLEANINSNREKSVL